MIRHLLATTAVATLLATSAYAQDATAPAPAATDPGMTTTQPAPKMIEPVDHLASNLIGESVYDGPQQDAQKIGDVNDLVIAKDGSVQSLVIGVGGFLGIGEKNVAIDYKDAKWAEGNGDRWLVVATSKDQLKAQPEFDTSAYDQPAPAATAAAPAATDTGTSTAMGGATTATPPAADQNMAADNGDAGDGAADTTKMSQDTAKAPAATDDGTDATATAAIDKSQLTEVPQDKMRAEDLVGTTVYGADDKDIGEIGDVVLTKDGKVDAILVDVGGFLGIGEKEVAVGMDDLAFMQDKDGNRYLYTNLTKEQLDAQTAYDKGTYAEQRDKQRLSITQ